MRKVFLVKQDTYSGDAAFACDSEEDAHTLSRAIWGESKEDTMVYDVPLIDDPFSAAIFNGFAQHDSAKYYNDLLKKDGGQAE